MTKKKEKKKKKRNRSEAQGRYREGERGSRQKKNNDWEPVVRLCVAGHTSHRMERSTQRARTEGKGKIGLLVLTPLPHSQPAPAIIYILLTAVSRDISLPVSVLSRNWQLRIKDKDVHSPFPHAHNPTSSPLPHYSLISSLRFAHSALPILLFCIVLSHTTHHTPLTA